jgi:hypothetical protein
MKTILLIKGVEPVEADAMLEAYQKNRAYAVNNHLSPIPNFRDLINLADEHYAKRLGVINEKQGILSKLNSESAPDYVSMIDDRVKNGESRHVILSEIETELDKRHGQLMSKKKEQINKLLETINATKFGENDLQMNYFIIKYIDKLNLPTNQNLKTMDDLIKELQEIKAGLTSKANTTIRAIINRFDVQNQWWLCFWYFGSGIKARRIEAAMANVPIEERAKLLESKDNAIHGVLTALASHRISCINPINQDNKIVVKKSANSYKTFYQQFNEHIKDRKEVITPPNNTPKL